MNKYWIPGPITNYGTTVAGFKGEVRVVEAAEFDRYAHANKVQAEEIKALAARLAEMRQAMDELHIKHGRSMRRLAEAEQIIRKIVHDWDGEPDDIGDAQRWLAVSATECPHSWANIGPGLQECALCHVTRRVPDPWERAANSAPAECHFKAFGLLQCVKPEGHDGDHVCGEDLRADSAPAVWKCSCGTSNADDYDRCLDCKGMRTWTQQADSASVCPQCNGRKKFEVAGREIWCPICNGTGSTVEGSRNGK